MAVDVERLREAGAWSINEGDEALTNAAADEIVRLRAEVERLTAENEALNRGVIHWTDETLRLTAERDAALATLAPHEALVAELREWMGTSDRPMWSAPRLAENLLARHGFGGDA